MAMGDVQPSQRAARPSKPYKPLKRPFNLFTWVASCGWLRPLIGVVDRNRQPKFLHELLQDLLFLFPGGEISINY